MHVIGTYNGTSKCCVWVLFAEKKIEIEVVNDVDTFDEKNKQIKKKYTK